MIKLDIYTNICIHNVIEYFSVVVYLYIYLFVQLIDRSFKMPRINANKDKRNVYTPEQKKAALEALESKSKTIRQISREFNVPRSTLNDWKNKGHGVKLGSGGHTALSLEEENLLVDALVYAAECGFPQSRNEVKNMVQSYVKSTRKKNAIFKWKARKRLDSKF